MKRLKQDTLTTFRGKNKQDISQNYLSLNWVKCHEIQLLLREAKIIRPKQITRKPCFQWQVFSYYHHVHITCSTVYEIKLRFVHLSDNFQGSYLEDFTTVRVVKSL